jgi:prevent-host-death family protein
MSKRISKSQLKPRVLEIFREVERTKEDVVVTDHGRPVLRIVPYSEQAEENLSALRGSVLRYDEPMEPVEVESWEALR